MPFHLSHPLPPSSPAPSRKQGIDRKGRVLSGRTEQGDGSVLNRWEEGVLLAFVEAGQESTAGGIKRGIAYGEDLRNHSINECTAFIRRRVLTGESRRQKER